MGAKHSSDSDFFFLCFFLNFRDFRFFSEFCWQLGQNRSFQITIRFSLFQREILTFRCAESESEPRLHVRIRFPMEQLIRTISGCMCNDIFLKMHFLFKIENPEYFSIIFFRFFLNFFTAKYSRNDCEFFEKIEFFDFSACMRNPILAKFDISLNLTKKAFILEKIIIFLSNFLQRDIWKIMTNF